MEWVNNQWYEVRESLYFLLLTYGDIISGYIKSIID
jgi:hypothetical protein